MSTVEHTKEFTIDIPISELFPLFSPEGEKEWVPGWEYQNLMGTIELSEDYVFLTKSHSHGTAEAIWLVKKFERDDHIVEFYKVEPGDKVGLVKIICSETSPAKTTVNVTYKYVALSMTGERFISGLTKGAYDEFIDEWETLLSSYYETRA